MIQSTKKMLLKIENHYRYKTYRVIPAIFAVLIIIFQFFIILQFDFSRLFQNQNILQQCHEDENKTTEQEVIYGLQVRYTRHPSVDATPHVTDCQYRGYAERYARWDCLVVDPKANPRKSHNAHTWNVHLKNVVHGSTAKYHCGRQT